MMNWKKSLLVVMLAGITVFTVLGCSKAAEPAPATGQTTLAVEQPAPVPDGTRPAPPEGFTPGDRLPAPAIDLATAAAKLGVTEQQLRDALGDAFGTPVQGPPDLAAAAQQLGISEEALIEALGFPEGGPPPGAPPMGGSEPTGGGQ